MSRIGNKPIPLEKGVTFAVEGTTVRVKGPKGEVITHMPGGVKLEQKDGHIVVVREDDSKAAIHGLVRALVNNSVEGVTKGWNRGAGHRPHRLPRRDEGQGYGGVHAGIFASH